MVQFQPLSVPFTEDYLPDTDGQPVDNELQALIPALLRAVLALLWAERLDWFLGVNMGVYYAPDWPVIVPDGFLSLGVPRYKQERGRLSYVVPQEAVVPQWVLEVVSQTPGNEYGEKMVKYAAMGVLYYTVYNPHHWRRDRHTPFEVYRLEQDQYVPQQGNPVWMPEVGLGIGYERGTHEGLERQWLYWYDPVGQRYPAPENVIQQERQRRRAIEQQLEQAEQQLEQAEQQLKQAEQQLEQVAQQRAQAAQQLAEERQRRSQLEQQAAQDRRSREELLERLRQRGINLDDLAD